MTFDQIQKLIMQVLRDVLKQKNTYLHYYYRALAVVAGLVLYALIFGQVSSRFSTREMIVTVPQQATGIQIVSQLYQKRIVRNYWNARLGLFISEYDRRMHAGRYIIRRNQSLSSIFGVLSEERGLSVSSSKRVIIPEGFCMQEIIDRLDAESVVSKNVFTNYLKTMDKAYWVKEYPFLNSALSGEQFFEGYLFPDTYVFAEDTTPQAVLHYMLYNFKTRAIPVLSQGQSKYTLQQRLTMASIVEKEAEIPEERAIIAGIFYNRLKKGIQLGSCPTIKYALNQPRRKYVLYKDLEVKSPYNTYKKFGLPPSPICSPGILSMQAAVQPQATDYYYFFARGDGSHVFSLSFKEHINKQRQVNGNKIY
jgi:UPF0755 protein